MVKPLPYTENNRIARIVYQMKTRIGAFKTCKMMIISVVTAVKTNTPVMKRVPKWLSLLNPVAINFLLKQLFSLYIYKEYIYIYIYAERNIFSKSKL